MKSILSRLLFEPVQVPVSRGRQVKFDAEDPDIMVSTGPLDERIAIFMRLRGYPMTAREIAAGIASNASQVNRGLRTMIAEGQVEVIDIIGSVRECALNETSVGKKAL
jgi:hypothetical protein